MEPGHISIKSRRTAFSTIPFAPDPDFVNRPEVLNWVSEKCTHPGGRAALVGLGGVGKSQIAIHYAHIVYDASPLTFVFWVHASSRAKFEEAYRDIADRLDLPKRHEPETDVMQLVYNWLCEESNGQWTMILDNADHVDVFGLSPDGQKLLTTYLPQSRNGSILVTSRSKDAAAKLTGGYNRLKEVHVMNRDQGLRLLCNKLQDTPEEKSATELLQTLNYIPLAISQAAAYINKRAHMTTAAYLKDFHTSSKRKELLLNWETGDLRRDESASNSVILTWQMSFECIQQERPSAAELLSLMSSFNPQGIPERTLRRYTKNKGAAKFVDEFNTEIDFEADLDLLRVYSLVADTGDIGMYEIHPLVQFCTRLWRSSISDNHQYDLEFIELMAEEFPIGRFEDWAYCQQLFPHIEPLFESEPTTDEMLTVWAQVATNMANYLYNRGNYQTGKKLATRAVSAREKLLGPDHEATLASLDILAWMLRAEGSYEEALQLFQRTLAVRSRVLGQDHKESLSSARGLAGVLHDQGKYEEAEKLYRRVLTVEERDSGPNYTKTRFIASQLAMVLKDQGNYTDAEKLCRRVLKGSESDPEVQEIEKLQAINELACVLRVQGKWDEAETLHRKALKWRRTQLGEQHPSTLASMNNLALVLWDQENYVEAEVLLRLVLEGRGKEFGEEHPDTLTGISNLASILLAQGKYAEAKTLNQQVLERREKILGEKHPDTLLGVNSLANALAQLKQYKEAAELFQRACDGFEQQLGPQHPWTIACRESLVSMHQQAEQAKCQHSNKSSVYMRLKGRFHKSMRNK
ncbi:hypothetical protein GQ44DRAFT_647501 [Phaeosphaeriaceae sp. PMI808]|nr:hypothetical protein GQ44DRAFT_647501 [Phaeosphaeriaceae sp. PMI808]